MLVILILMITLKILRINNSNNSCNNLIKFKIWTTLIIQIILIELRKFKDLLKIEFIIKYANNESLI